MRDLPAPLLEWQPRIEEALRRQLEGYLASRLPLYRMMQYQLGWVDKDGLDEASSPAPRLLGALCTEAAASTGQGVSEQAATAAAALELLHESLAVHEDMQVGEARSEARPAVWWIWGPAQAINVGDGLHALARLALLGLQEGGLSPEQALAVVGELDAASLRYYEGQYLELTYQERVDITEEQYVRMARSKRGALYGGAMAVGARTAGATEEQTEALRSFGSNLGLAAQVRDDIDAIWGQGSEGRGRLLNKSKLFPVVHALETGPVSRKRELGNIYFKRVMEPADLDALRKVLDGAGAREYAEGQAQAFAEEALQGLQRAGFPAATVQRWRQTVEGLLERNVE